MYETPSTHPQAGVPTCDRCGERPGRVRMVFANGGQRGEAVLCEQCAAGVMSARGELPQADAAPTQRSSDTPALDEFGRDLTEEAARGRHRPGDRSRRRDRADRRDPRAPAQEQRRPDRRARRRQDRHRRGPRPPHRRGRRPRDAARRAHRHRRPVRHDRRRPVPRPVRAALQGRAAGGRRRREQVVLFVDELHTILGAGNAEGAMDAASMLKPLLARGELRMVGATTLSEYRQIERDGALARRFSPVMVEEPSVEDTVAILRGLRSAYEAHHGALIDDAALEAAARLGDRYITEYHLPDKAIDLVDQAAARVKLRTGPGDDELQRLRDRARAPARREAGGGRRRGLRGRRQDQGRDRRARGAHRRARGRRRARTGGRSARPRWPRSSPARTGIPVGELVAGELARLQELERDLHQRVIGQDQAVEAVADTIRRARVGPVRGRPPAGHVPVPRPDRRRQDRAGQGAVRAAVRHREGARAHRHVRVPRAAHGGPADRIAARLRRLRRRRPAHRAGPAPPVLRRAARRDREGPPRGLERPAPVDGRRPPDRRRGPHGGLHEHRAWS